MLMHVSMGPGHVSLLREEFQPPKFPPNLTYGAGWTHVNKLRLIFLVFFVSVGGPLMKLCKRALQKLATPLLMRRKC